MTINYIFYSLQAYGKFRNPFRRLFEIFWENYLEEAKNYYRLNDFRQAGEKLYGAALTLIKCYAAIKSVPIMYWSRGKIERFITNNVEPELRKTFRDLLDKAQPLHEYFYEALKLLERIHNSIRFSHHFKT
ncbi:MAG: PaREP1 family protein [Candidatus Bathyarchaeia archaeon]